MDGDPAPTSHEAIGTAWVSPLDRMGTLGMPSIDRFEQLDGSTFHDRRLDRPGTWAVVLLASWCSYCRSFAPAFSTLADTPVHLATADLSRYESPLWDLFDIELVPTVIIFRDGAPVRRFDGLPGVGLGTDDVEQMRAALSIS